MNRQQEFVLRTLEERDIRFVRLWFTDVLGFLKSVAIAPAELEQAFSEGIGFDGSSIEGFARVAESDMLAKPDPATFQVLPWRAESPGTARMFCDILMPDGAPSYADPRWVLKRTLAEHPGSGMHTHLSLFEGDRNAFHEPGAEYSLSKTGRSFIAGLLHHASEFTAVTNQYVNSYKRLFSGGEAPSYISWGHNNRSALVRV